MTSFRWSAPQTHFPVKSLLTFPSSATTRPSSEVRSRTRLQVPHPQRRLGSQDSTQHAQSVRAVLTMATKKTLWSFGLRRPCWRWSSRPWSAREWQEQRQPSSPRRCLSSMERQPKVECCLASQSRPRNRDSKALCGAVQRVFFKSFFFSVSHGFSTRCSMTRCCWLQAPCNRKRVGLFFLSAVQNSSFSQSPPSILRPSTRRKMRARQAAHGAKDNSGQRAHTEPMSAMMWTVSVCPCVYLCVFVSLWVCVSVCVVCEVFCVLCVKCFVCGVC